MPGPTLCGELGEWVGDGNLLNCCPEDLNEPPEDDFDTRLRERSEGAWIPVGQLSEEDLHSQAARGQDDDAEDDATDGVPDVVYPDYTERMLSAASGKDLASVGAITRAPMGRYRRFARQSVAIRV